MIGRSAMETLRRASYNPGVRPLISLLFLGACFHDSPAAKPAPVPAPAPVAATWQTQCAGFGGKFGDVLDASADDCVKLTSNLMALEPDAKHKCHEDKRDPALEARLKKHGNFVDRCEKEKPPGFSEALDATIFTVEPFELDMSGVDLGGVFAPK